MNVHVPSVAVAHPQTINLDSKNKSLSWLHLSDLHAGQHSQEWLWPSLKQAFFNDLERLTATCGPLDLVIFSGDLTQRGSSADFELLTRLLSEVWEKFDKLGFCPSLFSVPGNHDLERIDSSEPTLIGLRRWWEEDVVRQSLFGRSDSPYLTTIQKSFDNYTAWINALPENGIKLPSEAKHGLLPGDMSCCTEINGCSVGLVGLNTAFLQLAEGNFEHRLDLCPQQLLAVTDNDPGEWCAKNEINLLVTHHPVSWLHSRANSSFNADIYPPGRFLAHIFGHLHEANQTSVSEGGATPRESIQGASLFGLRMLGDHQTERVHGYSVSKVDVGPNSSKTISLWPRISYDAKAGHKRLAPDQSFELDGNNKISKSILAQDNATIPFNEADIYVATLPSALDSFIKSPHQTSINVALSSAVFQRMPSLAVRDIRRYEQATCLASLREGRIVWVCSDWGLGKEGFLTVVIEADGGSNAPAYRLNLEDYESKQQFLATVASQLGTSLQEFCSNLATQGLAYLVLDEVPVEDGYVSEIEDVAKTILEFCPDLRIFLLGRTLPRRPTFPKVELKPLDEADTQTYIRDHVDGGTSYIAPDIIDEIYRRSDGVPKQIEQILRQLKYLSISELSELDPEGMNSDPSFSESAPSALVRAVGTLQNSKEDHLIRAFSLLKVLTLLPFGEPLKRICRFDSTKPFYPQQVDILLERGLLNAISVRETLTPSNVHEQTKRLVVPRPVRDYVRTLLMDKDVANINRKAVALYFGDKWVVGTPKILKADDLGIPTAEHFGAGNPHIVACRILREELGRGDTGKINAALTMIRSYCSALVSGQYFRSAVIVCRDAIAAITEIGSEQDVYWFQSRLASCLRMLGNHVEALDLLDGLKKVALDSKTEIEVLVDLMLVHASKNNAADAIFFAKKLKAAKPDESRTIHADSIILQNSPEVPDRIGKLHRLEKRARQKKYFAVANNIALYCASQTDDPDKVASSCRAVIDSQWGMAAGAYNRMRAINRMASAMTKAGRKLGPRERLAAAKAFGYAYGQRFGPNFNRCHETLWQILESEGDLPGLLRLFRHSSFVWRLNSDEDMEKKYLSMVFQQPSDITSTDIRLADRETAYFLLRSKALMPTQQTDKLNNDERT